jgi:hypothetical protein
MQYGRKPSPRTPPSDAGELSGTSIGIGWSHEKQLEYLLEIQAEHLPIQAARLLFPDLGEKRQIHWIYDSVA